jgi:hypothetical protein
MGQQFALVDFNRSYDSYQYTLKERTPMFITIGVLLNAKNLT